MVIYLIMYSMSAIHVFFNQSLSLIRSSTTLVLGGKRLCSGAAALTGSSLPRTVFVDSLYTGVSPSATRSAALYDSFLADGGS